MVSPAPLDLSDPEVLLDLKENEETLDQMAKRDQQVHLDYQAQQAPQDPEENVVKKGLRAKMVLLVLVAALETRVHLEQLDSWDLLVPLDCL